MVHECCIILLATFLKCSIKTWLQLRISLTRQLSLEAEVFNVLVLLATLLREISTLADSTLYFGPFYYLLIHIVGVFFVILKV
jgi:hypothetical protein